MSILQKLWPGRPEPSKRQSTASPVTDSDIDTIVNATSYVLKSEQVPPDVLQDEKQEFHTVVAEVVRLLFV